VQFLKRQEMADPIADGDAITIVDQTQSQRSGKILAEVKP
jgi:hypothetical protein